MESNWRWRVFEMGMNGGNFSLAARVLGTTDEYVVQTTLPGKPGLRIRLTVSASGALVPTILQSLGTGRFPYGLAAQVEPD